MRAFGLARDIQGYQRRLYASDARQHGVFELPKEAEFDDAAFNRLRAQIEKAWTKMRTENYPMLLERGAAFKAINMTAEDSDVAKVRDQAVREVCALFRVPLYKVGHLDDSKYSNIDAQGRSTSIRRWSRSRAASKAPRPRASEPRGPGGIFLRIRPRRDGGDGRQDARRNRGPERQSGIIMVDEGRRMQRLDPLPNGAGQFRSIPVNTTLVDENNEIVLQGASGQPQGRAGLRRTLKTKPSPAEGSCREGLRISEERIMARKHVSVAEFKAAMEMAPSRKR